MMNEICMCYLDYNMAAEARLGRSNSERCFVCDYLTESRTIIEVNSVHCSKQSFLDSSKEDQYRIYISKPL
jgi:hypothetical protein